MTELHSTRQQCFLKAISGENAFQLLDDELKSRILQDGVSLTIMPNDFVYIGCFKGRNPAGFISLKKVTKTTIEIHINIQKKYRGYARIFSNQVLDNLFKDPLINRIESNIPIIYPDVIKFVQKLGFIIEGEKRESFLKDGNLHNLITIGLLRGDYGRFKFK